MRDRGLSRVTAGASGTYGGRQIPNPYAEGGVLCASKSRLFGSVLCVLAAAILFDSYPIQLQMVPVTLTAGRVMLLIALFIWGIRHFHRHELPAWNRFVLYWMLLVLIFDLSTCFYSISPKDSLRSVGVKLEPFLVFLLFVDCFRNSKTHKQILRFALLLWACNGFYGLLQAAGRYFGFPTDIPFLQSHITKYYNLPSFESYSYLVRARSIFHDPNSLGGYLVLFLPLALAYGISSRRRAHAAAWFGMASLGAGGILLSYSRSGLLAMIASLAVFFVLSSRRAFWKSAVILAGAASVAFYLIRAKPLPIEYLMNRFNPSDAGARFHWMGITSAFDAFLSHPILGIGYGAFSSWDTLIENPHDVFLGFLSETGAVGFAIEMTFVGYLLVLGWKRLRKSKSSEESLATAGFIAGYCGLLVFNLTYWFYYSSIPWFFMALYYAYSSRGAQIVGGTTHAPVTSRRVGLRYQGSPYLSLVRSR